MATFTKCLISSLIYNENISDSYVMLGSSWSHTASLIFRNDCSHWSHVIINIHNIGVIHKLPINNVNWCLVSFILSSACIHWCWFQIFNCHRDVQDSGYLFILTRTCLMTLGIVCICWPIGGLKKWQILIEIYVIFNLTHTHTRAGKHKFYTIPPRFEP